MTNAGRGIEIRRVGVISIGPKESVREPLEYLRKKSSELSVEVLEIETSDITEDNLEIDFAIALGGDGTMLQALRYFLGTSIPVIGINFGRIGFLTSISRNEFRDGLDQVFLGNFDVVDLSTLEITLNDKRFLAVNDVVATSSIPGRMVKLHASLGGESFSSTDCDGIICCTPSGSTAYNLSNNGPVIMRGLDAMAMTYIAPHSLHSRPIVVPSTLHLEVTNETADVPVSILVDGRLAGCLSNKETLNIHIGKERARLALLPGVTFFSRYREVFLGGFAS